MTNQKFSNYLECLTVEEWDKILEKCFPGQDAALPAWCERDGQVILNAISYKDKQIHEVMITPEVLN